MKPEQKFQTAMRAATLPRLAAIAMLGVLSACGTPGYGLPDTNTVQRPATRSLFLDQMFQPRFQPPPPGTFDCPRGGGVCRVTPGFRPDRLQPAPGRDRFYLPPPVYYPPLFFQNHNTLPSGEGQLEPLRPIYTMPMSRRVDKSISLS